MPREPVVLDTNVFVAAGFNPRSSSADFIEAVKRGQLRMPWSDATRREIERVVRQVPPLRDLDLTELFRPDDRVAETHPERFGFVPDADDREFAALAAAAGATLVSNDEHLLDAADAMPVPVVTPGTFWRRHERTAEASPDE